MKDKVFLMKKKVFSDTAVPAFIFAAALVIALPLRTWQYFNVIEGTTGFFSENNFAVWLLYGVAVVACAAIIAVSYIKRKKFVLDVNPEKRPGCGILAAFLSVFSFADAMMSFNHALNLGLSIFMMPEYPDLNDAPQLHEVIEKIVGLEGLFALVSAVYFALCAIAFISGKSVGEKLRLLSLSPVIWNVLRIIYRFSITISYLRVSQLTFEMFMLIFLIVWFMSYAQVNSKVNGYGLEWKIVAYGLIAAFFALLCFIPQFIAVIAGRSDLLYRYSVPCYCDFAAAVYILSTVLTRISTKADEKSEEGAEVKEN